MKKLFTIISAFCLIFTVWAQPVMEDCGSRFFEETFDNFTLLTLPYGSNVTGTGVIQPLFLDVYQPVGDTLNDRPVLMMAFGGSFTYGDRKSPDIVEICEYFVKRGYVCVSIDYRLGIPTTEDPNINERNAVGAVIRGMHDGKAALRYLHANHDMLNIDTNYIYFGGVSAGGFISLHNAYLDREEEFYNRYPQSFVNLDDFGGLEGESGNPGFSSNFRACINLCGALGEHNWVELGEMPLLSMHGDADGTVPYSRDTIVVFGNVITLVSGSHAIDTFNERINAIDGRLVTWPGAGHVPFVSNESYMDSTQWEMRDFLYNEGEISTSYCGNVDEISDTMVEEPQDTNAIGIYELDHKRFSVYPNPTSDIIQLSTDIQLTVAKIYNTNGVLVEILNPKKQSFNIQHLPAGNYFIELKTDEHREVHSINVQR